MRKIRNNYRWVLAVTALLILVLGLFGFYAWNVTQAYREESYRQTFRGLDLIGRDIAGSLTTLGPILNTFVPTDQGSIAANDPFRAERDARYQLHATFMNRAGAKDWEEDVERAWRTWIGLSDKLTDLRATYSGLNVAPNFKVSYASAGLPFSPAANNCPSEEFMVWQFGEAIRLADCRRPEFPERFQDPLHPCYYYYGFCPALRFEASIPTKSLVDVSHVRGLVGSVLIADAAGNVVSETESQIETEGQDFVHLTSIAQFFGKSTQAGTSTGGSSPANVANNGLFPEVQSTVVRVQLSGGNFLLFVQPHLLPLPVLRTQGALATNQRFYVVGVARELGALENLRDLPIGTIGIVLGLLAILVISLPIVKMALIGADERLRWSDALFYLGSAVLIASGVALLVVDYAMYNALRGQMTVSRAAIADTIAERFGEELNASLDTLATDWRYWRDCNYGGKGAKSPCSYIRSLNDLYPPYHALTVLSGRGKATGQVAYRQRIEAAQDFSDRQYFQAARYGTKLQTLDDSGSSKQYFLERLRLRTTGDTLDALSIPVTIPIPFADPCAFTSPNADCPSVAVIVKHFLAFRSPILPPFFQFAVFDNESGLVVHHSDDVRSLLENFYAEFSRGDEVRAFADGSNRDGLEVDGGYLGRGISVLVRPLANSPWLLAVFYDTDAIKAIHFRIVAVTLLTMVFFTVVFLMLPPSSCITSCLSRAGRSSVETPRSQAITPGYH